MIAKEQGYDGSSARALKCQMEDSRGSGCRLFNRLLFDRLLNRGLLFDRLFLDWVSVFNWSFRASDTKCEHPNSLF